MTPFFMAWGMFFMIPCPYKKWDSGKYPQMLVCMPLIGLLIGLCLAAACWVLEKLNAGLLGAGILAALPWILTGFIHLDGYMDCADAVLSRREKEERLRILKDAHVGSFAVILMVVLGIVQFAACAGIHLSGRQYLALVFLPAVIRGVTAWAVLNLKPLPSSSYAKMFRKGVPGLWRNLPLLITLILAVLGPALAGRKGFCLLFGIAGYICTLLYNRADLGGMSGDVSGASLTVGELCALAALALL